MDNVLGELMKQAGSEIREEQEEAVLQIAMLLEKQLFPRKMDFYKTILPHHLLSLDIDTPGQQDLITGLIKLITSERRTPSMLWTLGKAKSNVGLLPLVNLLHGYSDSFDEESTWQALVAFENLVIPRSMDEQTRNYLGNDDFIRIWLKRLIDTGSVRYKEIAQRLLKKIENLTDDDTATSTYDAFNPDPKG